MASIKNAFKTLEAQGIVARTNFWCCQTCGLSAINEIIAGRQAAEVAVEGYVFFHQQDTQGASPSGKLYLAYGASEDDAPATATEAVGQKIVAALRTEGFRTIEWDGTASRRICVKVRRK